MTTIHRLRQILVLLLILLTLPPTTGVSGVAPAEAATLTFTVNSTTDAPDAHPGDGVCATQRGGCTLRAAIQEADAQPSGSSIAINVPSGTYTLTLGTLQLTANQITLSGTMSNTTTINGHGNGTVLAISSGVQATISGVTITGGYSPSAYGGGIYNAGVLTVTNSTLSQSLAFDGGGIDNDGTMTVSNSTFINNTTSGGWGGGIYNNGMMTVSNSTFINNKTSSASCCPSGGGIANSGTLTVTNSTVNDNTASAPTAAGGGLYNAGFATLTLSNSIVNNNTTSGSGGGIYNGGILTLSNSTLSQNLAFAGGGIYDFGPLTLSNSTISGNTTSGGSGGGIDSFGPLTVSNSTLISNTATAGGGLANQGGRLAVFYSTLSHNTASPDQGGGIFNDRSTGGTVTLTGTILSTNVPSGDCRGPISESQGFNLDSGNSCHFTLTTDITNTLPHLGLLRNNGGPTQTLSLEPGSPAIDHGGTRASGCPTTDQRGLPRPDEASDNGACDMGAYESQGVG